MKDKIKSTISKLEENKTYKGLGISIIILGLSSIIMVITFALSSGVFNQDLFESYLESPLLMLMNLIPILLTMILIFLISNKLWLGYSISALLFVVMGIINKLKLTYRDDPFIFEDIKLAGESIEMAGRYDISLSPLIISVIIALIAIGLILKVFFDFKLKSKKIRIGSLIGTLLIGIIIFNGFYFNSKVYAKVGDETKINKWIASQQFQSKGFVYPFIYSAKEARVKIPQDYDEELAEETLAKYEYKNIEEDKKVNLVTVMLEAYNDFSKFQSLEFNQDIYKYFHELQEKSISGKLICNVFAGNTINTERAFLTGYYHHPKYRSLTKSHVWYLQEQGYKTEAMHPITGSFYNRRNSNEYIGFENFDYYENKYAAVQEGYLMDMRFFDFVIEGYEDSIEEGRPYFNYALTYQNHGPYSDEKHREEEYLKKKPGYNDPDYNIINNYLAGIYETNQALEKLVDYFSNSQEPVVLVLFGDHNPWLGKDNSTYHMLDIDIDLATVDGFKNYYETPYIIWANQPAKEITGNDFIGQGPSLSPNHLMTETFENIGWQGNEYMQYLSEVKKELPINHILYFQEQGQIVPSSQTSLHIKALWKDFINLEYYMKTK